MNPKHIDRLATAVMESDEPGVVAWLQQAGHSSRRAQTSGPQTARWLGGQEARAFLAAVHGFAELGIELGRPAFSPALALRVAARIAERAAAVAEGTPDAA